jgi:vitamin B12 transporter
MGSKLTKYMFPLLLITQLLFSGSRVEGYVMDSYGDPISGVEVIINKLNRGEVTNSSGYFYFQRLNDGDYSITFNHLAYISNEIEIESGKKDLISLKVKLKDKDYLLDQVTFVVDNSDSGVKSVISPREIAETSTNNILDLLQTSTNIDISSTNGINTKLSIRGAESNQVTVLLDGVELNSSMDGSVDLRSIPTEMVERVEIYKGGDIKLSSKAVGGIINIITKSSREPLKIDFGYSNLTYLSDRDSWKDSYSDNHSYNLSLSKSGDDYGVIFSSTLTENINRWSYIDVARANEILYINNPNSAKNRSNSHFRTFSTFSKLNLYNLPMKPSLIISTNSKGSGMPGWIGKLYRNSTIENSEVRSSIGGGYEDGEFKLKLNLFGSYSEKRVEIDEKVTIFNGITNDFYRTYGLKFDSEYENYIKIFGGGEVKEDGVNSKSLGGDHVRDIISLYTQVEKQYPLPKLDQNIKLFAGGRLEFSSTNKRWEPFYSSGVVYDYKNSFFTLVNRSRVETTYRLPDFSSLFWFDNSGSQGNPDLLPERGISIENGSYLTLNRWCDLSLNFEIYRKDIDDLIVWQRKSNGTYTPVNLRGGEIKGVDFEMELPLLSDDLILKGGYNYLNTKTVTDNPATNGKEIIYKPNNSFSGDLTYKLGDFSFNYRYSMVGERYLTSSNKFPEYSYELHNLKIDYYFYLFGYKCDTFVKCNNILDKQYQVVYGYPMPGRSFQSGIKISI